MTALPIDLDVVPRDGATSTRWGTPSPRNTLFLGATSLESLRYGLGYHVGV